MDQHQNTYSDTIDATGQRSALSHLQCRVYCIRRSIGVPNKSNTIHVFKVNSLGSELDFRGGNPLIPQTEGFCGVGQGQELMSTCHIYHL